jgi:hypothetical protein
MMGVNSTKDSAKPKAVPMGYGINAAITTPASAMTNLEDLRANNPAAKGRVRRSAKLIANLSN